MRLARYEDGTQRSFGLVTDNGIIDLASRLGVPDIETLLAEGLLGAAHDFADEPPDVHGYRLLKPLLQPGKCFCVGMNYPDGRAGPSHPSLFQRVPDSFGGPGETVLRPPESKEFDYEGELVLVIGTAGRRIPRAQALDHVAGYMLANDGSVRDWMRHGSLNVTQGKNFYRSGALGPWITTRAAAGDGPFRLTTRVNHQIRQDDSTGHMLFPMDEIIAYVSAFTPLSPGDLILTGTPAGAGWRLVPPRWLVPGDVVEVEAAGLGTLRNTVADDA